MTALYKEEVKPLGRLTKEDFSYSQEKLKRLKIVNDMVFIQKIWLVPHIQEASLVLMEQDLKRTSSLWILCDSIFCWEILSGLICPISMAAYSMFTCCQASWKTLLSPCSRTILLWMLQLTKHTVYLTKCSGQCLRDPFKAEPWWQAASRHCHCSVFTAHLPMEA